MPITPHTVGLVVADMDRALGFYRALGLDVPTESAGAPHVECPFPGGYAIGFTSEAMMRQGDPGWVQPVGQRVSLAFRCDHPAEVDTIYQTMVAAGHVGLKAPWDAFWGQRYAFLRDPDGNRVDLFADASAV